ncbi:MAG: MarR family transcriptional regulator [Deltaproteobacteria bacterium]|nr:MarR family transcriptional regulator [Deltaproteobacteria bacterium]
MIHERFRSVVALAVRLEQTPRPFGTDEHLTSSEIHLIEIIGDNDEALSVTDLSKVLGVTKGAVSQNLKRTEKKGLTLKLEDPQNSSRSIVKLTSKGKTAYFAHKHWHETMDGGFKEFFLNLKPERIDFLIDFLAKLETFLKKALM